MLTCCPAPLTLQVKIVMKEVANTQYTTCMNPTAGSFTITPRMQRHFCTFAVQMPSTEDARCVVVYASQPPWVLCL